MTRVVRPFLRPSYPGLMEEESTLLRSYLQETDPDTVTGLRTNVGVGQGEVRRDLPQEFREMAQELSRLRMDAVVERGDRVELVELKSRIRTTGLGQLNIYKALGSDEGVIPTDSRLVLVGERIHPDVGQTLRQLGARVHVIPPSQQSRFVGQ